MLDFQVQLALGDQQLTEAEWRELMAADDGLVLLRGQWVEVDRQKLQEALDHWKQVEEQARRGAFVHRGNAAAGGRSRRPGRRTRATRKTANGRSSMPASGSATSWRRCAARRTSSRRPPASSSEGDAASVPGDGRQLAAVSLEPGPGGLPGRRHGAGQDDPGPGLVLGLEEPDGRKAVAAWSCRRRCLANWKAEMARFTPTLRAVFVHPAETPKEELDRIAADPGRALRNVDVVVTTYGMLLRQEWLLEMRWQLAVLDEAQAIKNPAARQTKTVKRLQADARIALTGTPVENRLSDLWSLFDFLCPGLLGIAGQVQGVRQDAGRPRRRTATRRCGAWCSRTSCGG